MDKHNANTVIMLTGDANRNNKSEMLHGFHLLKHDSLINQHNLKIIEIREQDWKLKQEPEMLLDLFKIAKTQQGLMPDKKVMQEAE